MTTLKLSEDLKLEYIKEYAMRFSVDPQNFETLLGNKDNIKQLGINLFQEIVQLNEIKKSQGLKPMQTKTSPPETLIGDLRKLYGDPKDTDVNFKIVEANALGISGSVFRCHKIMVASRSPTLAHLCTQPALAHSKEMAAIPVTGITHDGFTAFLKYIYYGQKQMSSIATCELVGFCMDYELGDLLQICVDNLSQQIDLDSVLTILDLGHNKTAPDFFIEKMKALRKKSLEYVVNHYTEIDFTRVVTKKLHRSIPIDVLIAIQKRNKPKKEKKAASERDLTVKKEKPKKKKKRKKGR